jgi:DNA ligase (NAD+)
VKKASHTTLPRLIYGLGIAGIGVANAKMLCREFRYDFDRMRHAEEEELMAVSGIGKVLADAWITYFKDEKNNEITDRLLGEVTIEQEAETGGEKQLEGMTFVITGSVEHFENRKALQEAIEAQGGKATGSVTSKTTYLINNDTTSNSSKNKKAKELGVPIISEEDFIKLLEG